MFCESAVAVTKGDGGVYGERIGKKAVCLSCLSKLKVALK